MIGAVVRSRGQRDLTDDGKRDWDKEIENCLDYEYKDWRNPETTCMIPETLQKAGSKGEIAETQVFNLLKAFGEERNEPMFVVHSYKFKERISQLTGEFKLSDTLKKWKLGEHDFVIIHRHHGFSFIQVKAAEQTAKRFREAQLQIEKDKDAIKIFLANAEFPKKDGHKVFSSYPGFVAMPNCPRPSSNASSYADGIFKEDLSSVEAFAQWWDNKIPSGEQLGQDLFNLLVKHFAGLVRITRGFPCQSSIDGTYKFLHYITREQLKVLVDTSSAQKWIVGPAGSGKTCLIVEKVIQLAEKILLHSSNEKILAVCYNRPLSVMLRKSFEVALADLLQGVELSSVVDVKTFDKLLRDIIGSSFNPEDGEKNVIEALCSLQQCTSSERSLFSYEHIFVDEGQDLYSDKWPDLLKMLHRSSEDPADEDDDLEPRFFWVCYDSNQHLHLSKEQLSPHLQNLRNSTRLYQVLRNTKKIYSQFRKYFEPTVQPFKPVGVYHGEDGLNINWDDSLKSDGTSGEQVIVKHLEYLKRNGVQSKDICILLRDANKQMKRLNLGVEIQNAEELWTNPENNRVVVESIRRFKGLQSKVVILYDPPFDEAEMKTRELLYTAFSRCYCYLIVISTARGCQALQSLAGLTSSSTSTSTDSRFLSPSPPALTRGNYQGGPRKLPSKRHHDSTADPSHNILYKKMKEVAGAFDNYLLKVPNSAIEDSVRMEEYKKLLPSVFQNLQFHPQYSDVTQPALREIVALLEYDVLRRYRNSLHYQKDMEAMKKVIDASTEGGEVNDEVGKVLGYQATEYQGDNSLSEMFT